MDKFFYCFIKNLKHSYIYKHTFIIYSDKTRGFQFYLQFLQLNENKEVLDANPSMLYVHFYYYTLYT